MRTVRSQSHTLVVGLGAYACTLHIFADSDCRCIPAGLVKDVGRMGTRGESTGEHRMHWSPWVVYRCVRDTLPISTVRRVVRTRLASLPVGVLRSSHFSHVARVRRRGFVADSPPAFRSSALRDIFRDNDSHQGADVRTHSQPSPNRAAAVNPPIPVDSHAHRRLRRVTDQRC